jgi:phosphonate transport system substrate-binding protein
MSKRILILLLLVFVNLLVTVPGCIAPAPPRLGKQVVTISVQPVYPLHVISQKYSPLIAYLSRETGYSVRLISAISYDSYFAILSANQVQIGIQEPTAYITLVKTRRAYPLAKMLDPGGNAWHRAVIFSLQGSGIDAPNDLKGKTVAATSRRSASGFLAQALICRQSGIDVNKDIDFLFVNTQNAVIDAVYQGKADAGFIPEDGFPPAGAVTDFTSVKIVAYTEYLPAWCVAAFDDTPPEVATAIDTALLSLDREKPEHREILEAIGISGFQKALDSDYDIVRELMSYMNFPY